MSKLLNVLARTPVLVFCFIAMIVIGFSFSLVQKTIGGSMLDTLFSAEEARARLAEMDADGRGFHALITATLDSLYPLVNFGFFAGVAARFSKTWTSIWKTLLLAPAFVYLIADFSENIVQIMALKGSENLLSLKDVFTPIKFTSFIAAALIALAFLALALIRFVKNKKRPSVSK